MSAVSCWPLLQLLRVKRRFVGMWYEILPSAAVMYMMLVIPGLSTLYIHRYLNNGKTKKMMKMVNDYKALQREKRLCGTGPKSLENID